MRRYALVLALLATACTGGGDDRPRAARTTVAPYAPAPGSLAVALGRCRSGQRLDDDPMQVLTRPGIWFRVDGLGIPTALDRRPVATDRVPGIFVSVGAGERRVRQLPGAQQWLYLRNGTADAISAALRRGAVVYVRTGGHRDVREVAYAVALRGNETALVGDCAYDDLTVPLARRVGPPDAYLRAMVGHPPAELRRIIRLPAAEAANLPANHARPPTGSPASQAGGRTRTARFALSAPGSWSQAGVVCVLVPGGRSACLSPYAASLGRTATFRYYADQPHGLVRFYRYERPGRHAHLATFSLSRDGRDPRTERLVLRVVLREPPSGAEVAADAQRGRDAVAAVRVERLP